MMLVCFLHAVLLRAVDTRAVRTATRAFGVGILLMVLLGGVARGENHAEAGPPPDEVAPLEQDLPDDPLDRARIAAAVTPAPIDPALKVAFFAESGRRLWSAGNRDGAERSFAAALNVNAPVATKRELMLEMAGLYREAGEPLKTLAILERFHQLLPDDAGTPDILLRLGVLHREVGALSTAIARFFQVLNSTLRAGATDLDAQRRLAMKARLEIAETYALQGNHEEARKYFSRLEVLDLDEVDRERVLFRGAQLQMSLGNWFEAERQLATFVGQYPQSPVAPESRYLRARALERLERREEAIGEVIALLRSEAPVDPAQAVVAGYWKRRTGNELANRFYEEGDIMGALSIYQALARASNEASWRWPAVYQIGLCFERLNLPQRAVEAYNVIVSAGEEGTEAGHEKPEALSAVLAMARWRLEHLDWVEDFGKRMQAFSAGKTADS